MVISLIIYYIQAVEIEVLKYFLGRNSVDISKWGTGNAKTLEHLVAETESGESLLEVHNRRIHRLVSGVGVMVYHKDLKLVEIAQVFKDGRLKVRNISTSVGEKLRPMEMPEAGAKRAMEEELGICGVAFANYRMKTRDPVPSTSFPGLLTTHNVHVFDAVIQAKDFSAVGYMELQKDKTNYYAWVLRETESNI